VRFNLISDLYYYVSQELNWLESRYYGTHTRPQALETGLDWNRQVFSTPFFNNFGLTYRDEEDAESPVSFLSGEDYLELFDELTWRPAPDFEAYVSARLRNIWADNPDVTKRMELNLYAGLRYLWDTGFRWEPKGTVAGYVYRDSNQNGVREPEEEGVGDITVAMDPNIKTTSSADSGFFLFRNAKGRNLQVSLDTSTLPSGFVLTSPSSVPVQITQGKIAIAYFGIASRTEISGLIFDDRDGDGQFSARDRGVKGVVITLDNGSSATTDETGRYAFRKLSAGHYSFKVDLSSIPPEFIPQVPIFKEIDLSEGSSYVVTIPLKKAQ
jgi:hypothetical protein